MKWNDIKKHFARINNQTSEATSLVSDKKLLNTNRNHHRVTHWIFLSLIVIAVAIGIIALIKVFSKDKVTPILPTEELKSIGTFLDQNPPQPLTPTESVMVEKTISQPVSLDNSDVQALESFFNR
jgi:hypothetical protein